MMLNTLRHLPRTGLMACMTAGLGLFSAASAQAQAFDTARIYGAAPERDGGRIGLVALAGHAYQGSKKSRAMLVPSLDYQWSNGWFAGTSNGLGLNFSKQAQFSYGLRLTADFGRDEDRSPALRGMGDIEFRPEIGGFFNYSPSQSLALTSSLRYGSGQDRKGLLIDLGVAHQIPLDASWRLGVGAALTLANREALQSYFGVSAAQAASSGYAPYSLGAGLRDVRANASLTHILSPRSSVTAGLSVSALQGDAKNSPLTHQKTSVNGLVAFGYLF